MASASNRDVGYVSLRVNTIAFVEKGDLLLAPGPAELDHSSMDCRRMVCLRSVQGA